MLHLISSLKQILLLLLQPPHLLTGTPYFQIFIQNSVQLRVALLVSMVAAAIIVGVVDIDRYQFILYLKRHP